MSSYMIDGKIVELPSPYPIGTRLRFTGQGGYPLELKNAERFLKVGQVYTLRRVDVDSFQTRFELEEVRGVSFNSVHFEEVWEPKVGQKVRTKEETSGCDHEDTEHVIPAGAIGTVERFDNFGGRQGRAYTVAIPVPGLPGHHIVNVFDEGDGPFSNFLEPVQD